MINRTLDQGRVTVLFAIAACLSAALCVQQHVSHTALLIWLVACLGVYMLRLLLVERGDVLFTRLRDKWYAYCALIALAGVSTGSFTLFWGADLPLSAQLVIVLFPVVMSLASLAVYVNSVPAFLAFALPAQLPLLTLLLLSPSAELRLVSIPTLIMIVGQCVLVGRVHAQLRETLRIRLENEDLALSMQARNRELERAHDLLHAANDAKATFLARLNLDFRTPINGVLGMSQALGRTNLDKKQADYLSVLESAGGELRGLVDELLGATIEQSGESAPDESALSVASVVDSIIGVLQPLANTKGVTIASVVDSGVPEAIRSDAERLRQMLFALVDNAVKFTEVGDVVVRIAVLGGTEPMLRIIVEDTGAGMPSTLTSSLVQLFSPTGAESNRGQEASGIGLLMVSRILRTLQGRADISSTVGVGTRVMVDIPLVAVALTETDRVATTINHGVNPVSAARAPLEQAARTPSFGIDVLVAEDKEVNRVVLDTLLAREGVEVRYVEDGEAAIEAVRQKLPDVVLMDCLMPVMDGYEATAQLRALGVEIPIIAVTAKACVAERQRCISAGMNDCLLKPLDAVAIDRMLERWCDIGPDRVLKAS